MGKDTAWAILHKGNKKCATHGVLFFMWNPKYEPEGACDASVSCSVQQYCKTGLMFLDLSTHPKLVTTLQSLGSGSFAVACSLRDSCGVHVFPEACGDFIRISWTLQCKALSSLLLEVRCLPIIYSVTRCSGTLHLTHFSTPNQNRSSTWAWGCKKKQILCCCHSWCWLQPLKAVEVYSHRNALLFAELILVPLAVGRLMGDKRQKQQVRHLPQETFIEEHSLILISQLWCSVSKAAFSDFVQKFAFVERYVRLWNARWRLLAWCVRHAKNVNSPTNDPYLPPTSFIQIIYLVNSGFGEGHSEWFALQLNSLHVNPDPAVSFELCAYGHWYLSGFLVSSLHAFVS